MPSGLSIEMRAPQHDVFPIVTLVRRRVTRWPAAPSKPSVAFCPGTGPSVRLTGPPPIAIEPVRSAGTSWSVRVIEPRSVPCGSTRIVYVPLTGSSFASMKPPFRPTGVA